MDRSSSNLLQHLDEKRSLEGLHPTREHNRIVVGSDVDLVLCEYATGIVFTVYQMNLDATDLFTSLDHCGVHMTTIHPLSTELGQ